MCRRTRRRCLSLLRCRASAAPEARRFWPPFRAGYAVEREAAALGRDGAELRAAAVALLGSTGPEAEEQE